VKKGFKVWYRLQIPDRYSERREEKSKCAIESGYFFNTGFIVNFFKTGDKNHLQGHPEW
jgi:hypothetical protein